MGAITIRSLDDQVIAAINRQAAERGVSMEQEIRTLLTSAYSNDHRHEATEWAERQLERLNRRELPKLKTSSLDIIREMREELDQQLMDAIKGPGGEPDR
jgi:plasmid stability protein